MYSARPVGADSVRERLGRESDNHPKGHVRHNEAMPPPPQRPAKFPPGPPPPAQQQQQEIDREKVCPLLLRVFPKMGGHHRLEEFAVRGKEPQDELHIYTWPDANLRELSTLVKQAYPAANRPGGYLQFAFVYPDRRGRNVLRPVGQVHNSRPGPDDDKSLRGLNFQTGDYLDVAIN